jgi:hypothetical protein
VGGGLGGRGMRGEERGHATLNPTTPTYGSCGCKNHTVTNMMPVSMGRRSDESLSNFVGTLA